MRRQQKVKHFTFILYIDIYILEYFFSYAFHKVGKGKRGGINERSFFYMKL